MRTCKTLSILLFLAILTCPALGLAQGLLIVVDPDQVVRLPRPIHPIWPPHPPRPVPPRPEPEASYAIESLNVNARLSHQVADVQVSQTFKNTGSRQLEVAFVFPLPYDGAISQMTLMVDGKEYPAQLLDKDQARSTYESIVRKNQDPALLEWIGTGMFRTSVFPVPAGASRTVTLEYTQLLRQQDGVTDFLFPLSTARYTARPVESIDFRVTIESPDELKNVYSPTHQVKIKRPDDQHATVTCKLEKTVPNEDFRLLYDVGRGQVGARVLSYRPDKNDDGYFMLLAAPKIKSDDKKPQKKTVIFVLDRSGSMSGKKIEQARESLKFVMNNLHEGDLMNIIAYDSKVELFRPELQRVDDETRRAAIGFCESIYAGGSTNIDGALQTAMNQLKDSDRPSYVIFLTDGLPTTGETNEMKIVDNCREVNRVDARLFSFGVGYDVNSRLLDKLARENHGQSDFVKPDEDIEERVSRLYSRIASPVMTDVSLTFELDDESSDSIKPISRVYPEGRFDLFAGEQLVMVGRYKASGPAKVIVSGQVRGKEQSLDFPAKLVNKSDDERFAFIEKLWAMRRIGEILDELDLKGSNSELIDELVELSKRHGILTPYTSFLADENTNLNDLSSNVRRAGQHLEALGRTDGYEGVAQRSFKAQLQYGEQAGSSDSLRLAEDASRVSRAISAPASSARPGAAGPGAYGNGGGYGGRGIAPVPRYDADRESAESKDAPGAVAERMRTIGNRTFYLRDGQWIDSTVTEDQKKKATKIKQFSNEYFKLAREHGRTFSQYMVFDEPVLVNVDGRSYLIEP